jgi:N6-adenosine-specific RNA methylase IME4
MTAKRYRTIVADPPWQYDGGVSFGGSPGKLHGTELPYPSMPLSEIAALPICDLAERDAWVFFWVTGRYLSAAFTLIDGWGLTYRQMFTWAKLGASPFGGTFTHNAAEYLIASSRGAPQVKGRWPGGNVITTNRMGAGSHSRKPDVFLDLVEQVSPGPYLELFARRNRFGWDTWGNECFEHVEMDGAA